MKAFNPTSLVTRIVKVGMTFWDVEVAVWRKGMDFDLGTWRMDIRNGVVKEIFATAKKKESAVPDVWLTWLEKRVKSILYRERILEERSEPITANLQRLSNQLEIYEHVYTVYGFLVYNYLLIAIKSIIETADWWEKIKGFAFSTSALKRFEGLWMKLKDKREKVFSAEQQLLSRLSRAIAAFERRSTVESYDVERAYVLYDAILYELFNCYEPAQCSNFTDPGTLGENSTEVKIFGHWRPATEPGKEKPRSIILSILAFTRNLYVLDRNYHDRQKKLRREQTDNEGR